MDIRERGRKQLIEDVVVSLQLHTVGDSWLLEQIGLNICAGYAKILREMDANELAETRRVIVTRSLCISISFQDRIGLNNLILQAYLDRVLKFFFFSTELI